MSAPYFIVDPLSVVANQRSALTLNCSAEPDGIDMFWILNGSRIASKDGLITSRHLVLDSVEQEGTYQCVANNSVGSVRSGEAVVKRAGVYFFRIS